MNKNFRQTMLRHIFEVTYALQAAHITMRGLVAYHLSIYDT